MSDHAYDALSYKISKEAKTGNRKLDNFFKKYFEPATGMWIRKHPELNKLKSLYHKYYEAKDDSDLP